MINLMDKIKGL